MRDEFVGVVEQITGRSVAAFLGQVDVDADLALEFFLFAPMDGGQNRD